MFAAQVVLANAVGILPLIVAGSVADIFGVTPVLFAIALRDGDDRGVQHLLRGEVVGRQAAAGASGERCHASL